MRSHSRASFIHLRHYLKRETVKKSLYLLPLLLGIFACVAQSSPTQNVSDIVNATLTTIAQNNPQVIAPQTALTPSSDQVQPTAPQPESSLSASPASTGNITYFWPSVLPEGFILSPENSHANANGFALEFVDSNQGIVLRLLGGTEADQYQYCVNNENNPSEPATVRALGGCFPAATGGGFSVEWKENGTHYIVGGMSVSKELALATAEQLESIDLSTFLARLVP